MIEDTVLLALRAARDLEREQAQFYRYLAVQAEDAGDEALSERLQDLHADEQHHLSRLSARLLELDVETSGGATGTGWSGEERGRRPELPPLDAWEPVAREREDAEVRRYEALLQQELDAATRALVEQIVEVERHHLRDLAGKWTPA